MKKKKFFLLLEDDEIILLCNLLSIASFLFKLNEMPEIAKRFDEFRNKVIDKCPVFVINSLFK